MCYNNLTGYHEIEDFYIPENIEIQYCGDYLPSSLLYYNNLTGNEHNTAVTICLLFCSVTDAIIKRDRQCFSESSEIE